MKITVKAEPFKQIISRVADSIPAKTPEPAYMNFLLTIKEDSMELLGSDGSTTMKSILSKTDKKGEDVIIAADPGKIQVPAKLLVEVVSKMTGNLITLNLIDETILSISDENTFYKINSMNGNEYPDIDMEFDGAVTVKVTGEQFHQLYQSTYFAVATKGTRQYFTGINVRANSGKISFLATDACRLAQKTVELGEGADMVFTVPVKVLGMVDKMDDLEDVTISFAEGKALFKVGDSIYLTRLYNGDFPSADKIKPVNTPYTLTVDAAEFVAALDRVTLVTMGEPSPIAKLVCTPDGVEVAASSQNNGAAHEVLKNAKFNGEMFQILFNVKFVGDAVRALGTKDVTLAFAGEGKLFVVQNGDDSNLQIITPIRSNF